MNINIAQWIGKRGEQEDAYAYRHYPEGCLAVVCDGMGGHDCGSLAAKTAAEAFVEAFDKAPEGTLTERLRMVLDKANEAVGDLFRKRGSFGGTTLLAVYCGAGVLRWVSVGDSPLLLWRHGRLMRLNADHSMRAIYACPSSLGAKSYGVDYVDSVTTAFGHSLRSAVTGDPLVMVDAPLTPYPLLPGDRIIMSSDGVDDLLLQSPMSPDTQAILDKRGAGVNLSAEIVDACKRLDDPNADNVTVLSMDW